MSSKTEDVRASIAELRRILSWLAAADLSDLQDAALLDCLRAVRPAVSQAQAVEHRLVAAVHDRGAVSADGARSTERWLRESLHLPKAKVVLSSASGLGRLPQTARAFAAGQISEAHVATIVRVARDLPTETLNAGAEAALVDSARRSAPSSFVAAARKVCDEADPPTAQRRRSARPTRWLSTSRADDGAVALTGRFDADAGRVLLTALATVMGPPDAQAPAPTRQRRADALVAVCRLAIDRGLNHIPDVPDPEWVEPRSAEPPRATPTRVKLAKGNRQRGRHRGKSRPKRRPNPTVANAA